MAAESVKELERRLTGAQGAQHLNDIAKLYDLAESSDIRTIADALKAIPRVLAHHRHLCRVAASDGDAKASAKLLDWLREHGEAYQTMLCQLAASKNPKAQVMGVRLLMGAVQEEDDEVRTVGAGTGGAGLTAPPPATRIRALLTEVLLSEHWSAHVAECIMGEFCARYVDVRHHVLNHLRSCAEQAGKAGFQADGEAEASQAPKAKKRRLHVGEFAELVRERGLSSKALFIRTLAFLKESPAPSEDAMLGQAGNDEAQMLAKGGQIASFFVKEYRKLFQNAWVQLLNLRVPLEQCQPLLQLVPAKVMPYMSQPLLLAGFYMQAFQSGSAELSVLSLSGLFLLLTRYGLGDPDTLSTSGDEFYARLYSLLTTSTLQLRQRVRFQRLLATSLASDLLPARFAAAFAKKCMRLAVSSTEHGTSMWLLSITYTLIQKHHSHCRYLLHKAQESTTEEPAVTTYLQGKAPSTECDPFDTSASLTLALEQAAQSSLWELQLLRQHHVPAVATLAKLFLKPFFKPTAKKLDPELFLDQSNALVYEQAVNTGQNQLMRWRRKGQACPVAFKLAEHDDLATRIVGWSAALSTSQRKIGAGV